MTISTELTSSGGLTGFAERFALRRLLRRIYARELEQLGRVAAERSAVRTTACWASYAVGA